MEIPLPMPPNLENAFCGIKFPSLLSECVCVGGGGGKGGHHIHFGVIAILIFSMAKSLYNLYCL